MSHENAPAELAAEMEKMVRMEKHNGEKWRIKWREKMEKKWRDKMETCDSNGASRDVAVQTRWTWCTALGSQTPLVLRQDGIMGAVECRTKCMQRAP